MQILGIPVSRSSSCVLPESMLARSDCATQTRKKLLIERQTPCILQCQCLVCSCVLTHGASSPSMIIPFKCDQITAGRGAGEKEPRQRPGRAAQGFQGGARHRRRSVRLSIDAATGVRSGRGCPGRWWGAGAQGYAGRPPQKLTQASKAASAPVRKT